MKSLFLKNLKVKKNLKGNITKLLDINSSTFSKFGEIYISEINKNDIKGWKMHNKNNLNLFVISGEVKFVLLSKSQKFFEYKINFNSKKKIYIPSQTWFAFMGVSNNNRILSFIDNLHNDDEVSIKDIGFFKYDFDGLEL